MTRDILVGQYRTGERLPSERDLASRFDANRGAVREAMKKLEQLGLACIQPGGARVAPIEESNLDVISHLLGMGEVPDRALVKQILGVISSLIQTAAADALERASDDELEAMRRNAQRLYTESLTEEEYMATRMQLMSGMMRASGNLVVQLIARSLLLQFVPSMTPLQDYGEIDLASHRLLARELDEAMGRRDIDAVRATFIKLAELNQHHVMAAYEAYESARTQGIREVAAS